MNAETGLTISRYLEPGESLIWSGAPKQGLLLRGADAFLIPFSIMWCGFAIFWEAGVLTAGAPFFFALFGVPFVLVGLYFMVGRFFLDAKIRAKTAYALTNQRVLIVSGIFSRSITSLPLRTLNDISLRERHDGRGTVSFGRPHPFARRYAGMQWPGMSQYDAPNFELIENAKRVYDQVMEAQRAAT